ncbi:MAG TPA: hypothetical protein VHL34_24930 [Rhizomicrobium sp.]|jgi:hypothetical protein|nr:hypothetical protein [Rhizomicrobium sp.]
MTEDQLNAYAGALADAAIVSTADPAEAASVLIQAAVAVLVATRTPEEVMKYLEMITDATVASFRPCLQPAGSVQ